MVNTADYTIVTERLILREICKDDTEIIVDLRSDPNVYRYFRCPHALTADEHNNWYNNVYLKSKSIVSWICRLQEKSIGVFSAEKKTDTVVEISYLLAGEYQGNGFATEAVEAIEKWTQRHWKVEYAVAEIHKDNVRSIRFANSIGYINDSEFKMYKKKLRKE